MAKGYQKNQEHKDKVALLGKKLIRRCKRKCELCEAGGTGLTVVEVAPVPAEPHEDHAIMLCDDCKTVVETGKMKPHEVRFLESIIWSDVPAVQVTVIRLCRQLSKKGVDWASDVLDVVHLNPGVEQWLADD